MSLGLYRAAADGQDAAVLRISEAGRRNSKVMRDTTTALSESVSAITSEIAAWPDARFGDAG